MGLPPLPPKNNFLSIKQNGYALSEYFQQEQRTLILLQTLHSMGVNGFQSEDWTENNYQVSIWILLLKFIIYCGLTVFV